MVNSYKSGIIGCDVGGTFTDFISIDQDGSINAFKVQSTANEPALAVEQGLAFTNQLWTTFLHGTTIATNMLLERKGSKILLISTEGFPDIIEIGRQNRINLYRPASRPRPLVSGQMRIEAPERISATGEIIRSLDQQLFRKNLHKVPDKEKIDAIVVCLLFSFLNPIHEQQIQEILKEMFPPAVYIALSSEVLPIFREYERTSTTVLDAYVAPHVKQYLQDLQHRIQTYVNHIYIMQSNGGISLPETLQPVNTLLSGLAGGLLAAQYSGKACHEPDIISLDIGGTSTDVSLLKNYDFQVTTESKIGGFPLALPVLSIETVGAGGGSIVHLDRQGLLQVGPQSAGADPGPVCYGKTGTTICMTDADVYLGWLHPENFAGGKVTIFPELISQPLQQLGEQIKLSNLETAQGIQQIFHNNVAQAILRVSLERGHDPREFTLVVFGGAGSTHACAVAELLSISKILVPPFPGIWSAFGLLTADFKFDHQISIIQSLTNLSEENLTKQFEPLEEKGKIKLLEANFTKEKMLFQRYADMRYKGQSYELRVTYPDDQMLVPDRILFDRLHHQEYGFSNSHEPIEVVNIGVVAIGFVPSISFPEILFGNRENPVEAQLQMREMYWQQQKYSVPIYLRNKLLANDTIQGPCIIEQADTTTIVGINWLVVVKENGHLEMEYQLNDDNTKN